MCTSTIPSFDGGDKPIVEAASSPLNRGKSKDKSTLVQRSSSNQDATLRVALEQLLSTANDQVSQDGSGEKTAVRMTRASSQNSKAALAQLLVRLLENRVSKQDMSDEDKVEIQTLLSKVKKILSDFGNKVKGGLNTVGEKVKNFFNSIG